MIKNERGFTYPLTLSILLLISLLLTVHLELYLNEKRIIAEENVLLKQEFYFFRTLKHVEELLRGNESSVSGVLSFHNGYVAYQTKLLSEEQVEVTYQMYLEDEYELTANSFYDKNIDRMTKWVEKN